MLLSIENAKDCTRKAVGIIKLSKRAGYKINIQIPLHS